MKIKNQQEKSGVMIKKDRPYDWAFRINRDGDIIFAKLPGRYIRSVRIRGMNDLGWVALDYDIGDFGPVNHFAAAIWIPSTTDRLEDEEIITFGDPDANLCFRAHDINNRGQALISIQSVAGHTQYFVWSREKGLHFPFDDQGTFNTITESGWIGGAYNDKAAIWDPAGNRTDISIPSSIGSTVLFMNERREAIIYSHPVIDIGQSRFYYWSKKYGVIYIQGLMPLGTHNVFISGISSRGEIAVNYYFAMKLHVGLLVPDK